MFLWILISTFYLIDTNVAQADCTVDDCEFTEVYDGSSAKVCYYQCCEEDTTGVLSLVNYGTGTSLTTAGEEWIIYGCDLDSTVCTSETWTFPDDCATCPYCDGTDISTTERTDDCVDSYTDGSSDICTYNYCNPTSGTMETYSLDDASTNTDILAIIQDICDLDADCTPDFPWDETLVNKDGECCPNCGTPSTTEDMTSTEDCNAGCTNSDGTLDYDPVCCLDRDDGVSYENACVAKCDGCSDWDTNSDCSE
eukprot:388225_1